MSRRDASWRETMIRFQATISGARLFITWQPCIREWSSKTPQHLPKVPTPTIWIDIIVVIWFDSLPKNSTLFIFVLVLNSSKFYVTQARLELPLFTHVYMGTCTITASNTTFLQHWAKPNAGPLCTLDYKALWSSGGNHNPASQPDREILWMVWQPRCWPTSAVFEGYVSRQTWTNDLEHSSHIPSRF